MSDDTKSRTRWPKGVSGNPGGRPKVAAEVRELAQQHCPRAIARLAELMESDDERVAVAASAAMLDRGVGRAPQAIDLTIGDNTEAMGIAQVREAAQEALRDPELRLALRKTVRGEN